MNRRRFIQSLVSVFSLPAATTLPLPATAAALPTAASVPTQARFWTIYMSALHGECKPQMLQKLLGISKFDAEKYVGQLLAEGVVKPSPILQQTASEVLKGNQDRFFDKANKRLQMKAQAKAEQLEFVEAADTAEPLDSETLSMQDHAEFDQDDETEDETHEIEVQTN